MNKLKIIEDLILEAFKLEPGMIDRKFTAEELQDLADHVEL